MALEYRHLLPKGEDLTIPVVNNQTADQRRKGREEQQDDVPEHAKRIVQQLGEVKAKKA